MGLKPKFLFAPEFRLLCGVACIGFAPILVKASELSASMIGFYRCLLGFLIFIPFVCRKSQWSSTKKLLTQGGSAFWGVMVLAGVMFSVDLFTWHKAIYYIGAGLATMLANGQVFLLAIFGVLYLGEPFNLKFVASLIIGFVGLFLLADIHGVTRNENYLTGVIYGLSTSFAYAIFIVCLRNSEKFVDKITPEQKNLIFSLFTALGLFVIGMVAKEVEWPSNSNEWILIVALAVIGQVLGWQLITTNLSKIPVSRAGLIILAQPIFAGVFGWMIFGEVFSSAQLMGAALTLFAMYLGNTRKA